MEWWQEKHLSSSFKGVGYTTGVLFAVSLGLEIGYVINCLKVL